MANTRQTKTFASIPPIETGSFSLRNREETNFVGSASGIFFVHTVFQAFSELQFTRQSHEEPSVIGSPEASALIGDPQNSPGELDTGQSEDPVYTEPAGGSQRDSEQRYAKLGIYDDAPWLHDVPLLESTRALVMIYFRHWHPRFPFLHGPAFLSWVDSFYQRKTDSADNFQTTMDVDELCQQIIFHCVLSIAEACQSRTGRASGHRRRPPLSNLLDFAARLSVHPATLSLQALLAIELYLITSMSLRSASICHGVLIRALYHSGYHRCPYRYAQLPRGHTRDVRKRIFWSAYVMDRYLSQVLGIPIGIHDTEVDVCFPTGPELHSDVKPSDDTRFDSSTGRSPEVLAHLPKTHPDYPSSHGPSTGNSLPTASLSTPRAVRGTDMDNSIEHVSRPTRPHATPAELVLTCQVQLSQLVGEIIILCHGSIHAREMTRQKIQSITYRLHAWQNHLPQTLETHEDLESEQAEDGPIRAGVNYNLALILSYHYSLILVSRPFLSLPREDLDFRESIQNSINASRQIARILERLQMDPFLLSWPMTLSATWMAGLVLSFAGLLRLVPMDKVSRDLDRCLATLYGMSAYWPSAHHCHRALKRLLNNLKQRDKDGSQWPANPLTRSLAVDRIGSETSAGTPSTGAQRGMNTSAGTGYESVERRDKRRRRTQDGTNMDTHNQLFHRVEMNPMLNPNHNWQNVPSTSAYTAGNPESDIWSSMEGGFEPFVQDSGLLQLNSGDLFSDATWESYLDGCIPSFDP